MIVWKCPSAGCTEPLSVPESMAGDVIQCPLCGTSTRAPLLPAHQALEQAHWWNRPISKRRLTAVWIVVAAFVVFGFVTYDDQPPATETQAVRTAKSLVLQSLKAPSTAQWPRDSIRVSRASEDRWIVAGSVDSQNSFGATVRTDWQTEFKLVRGSTVPLYMNVGGEVLYDKRQR